MYEIIGIYKGQLEVVDEASSIQEANYLLGEYRIAFGKEWSLRIRRLK